MKLTRQTIIFCFILIAVTTLIKVICAPQIDLSGSVKEKKIAFLLPLLTLFISDVLLQVLHTLNLFPYPGFYNGQLYNYALFILITLTGIALRNYKIAGIVIAAFMGPTIFFLLSNFIVWKTQGSAMGYSNDLSGLMQSYTLGLPFYRNSLVSTFIFLPFFIALYHRMLYGKFSLQPSLK